MIDTHCHIDLYPDPLKIANDSEKNGIITIGVTNLPSHFEIGRPFLLYHKKVRLALGMHPLYADQHSKELPLFFSNLENTSFIGEIGLDFSREGLLTKDIQIKSFDKILSSLEGKNKILSIHSRRAEKEVLRLLRKYQIRFAIFHWYSGPISLINHIIDAGYYFSVNTAMINSKSGQEIIKKIPKSRLLTESDGPFISINGSPAQPKDIDIVIEYLSKVWGDSKDQVEKIIKKNFFSLIDCIK